MSSKAYGRATVDSAAMEKVDGEGRVIGFSVLKVSAMEGERPVSVTLR